MGMASLFPVPVCFNTYLVPVFNFSLAGDNPYCPLHHFKVSAGGTDCNKTVSASPEFASCFENMTLAISLAPIFLVLRLFDSLCGLQTHGLWKVVLPEQGYKCPVSIREY